MAAASPPQCGSGFFRAFDLAARTPMNAPAIANLHREGETKGHSELEAKSNNCGGAHNSRSEQDNWANTY